MRGRASVAISLSDEERGFLEAQLRRHKTANSAIPSIRLASGGGGLPSTASHGNLQAVH